MARGWESKSIESQIEAAAREKSSGKQAAPQPEEEAELQKKRNRLILDRTRVLNEIQSTSNPRFRGQLDMELNYLDGEIKKLERG